MSWRILAAACLAASGPSFAAPPTIDAASWLVGRWVGDGLGGQVEEVWSPAAVGQMVGHFQLAKYGKPQFYEILLLDATPAGLRMRVKHFNADFTAWENKGDWVTFVPESTSANAIRFKGLSVERQGERVIMKLQLRSKDGKVREELFNFRRARD